MIAAGVLFVACAVSAIFVVPRVWRAASEGRETLVEASRAVLRRDAAAAKVEFAAARELFASSRARLDSPLSLPLRIVPVARTHVRVAGSLSRIGTSVSDAGISVAEVMEGLPEQGLRIADGRMDLEAVRRAGEALRAASAGVPDIEMAVAEMPSGWVGGPLAGPRDQVRGELPSILEGIRKAEAALEGLPSLLGEGATKRYLIAFSNLSELRGSGGLFGFVTAIRATDGDLDLEDVAGRPTEIFPPPGDVDLDLPQWFPDDLRTQSQIFQNINMSTDFPTVGRLVVQTAEARLGGLDGVFAVDPDGIAAILALVGDVEVPSWPGRITASNVAKIATHDVYVSITDNDRRERFFAELVRAAFDRLTSATVRLSADSAGAFDRAIAGGHFRMYSDHAPDQATFERIGAAGAVARADDATDVLSVVSQNAGGNKLDWYLRRELRYTVRLDPDAGTATSALEVTFANTAPSSGLPDYIIGSALEGLPRGTNRHIVMLLRASGDDLESLEVDDREVIVVTEREVDLRAHRTTVDMPPQGRSTLTAVTSTPGAVTGSGDERLYRLRLLRQATATPDFAEVEVSVPVGWEATGRTRFLGDLSGDLVLEVRLRRTVTGSILDRLFGWIG